MVVKSQTISLKSAKAQLLRLEVLMVSLMNLLTDGAGSYNVPPLLQCRAFYWGTTKVSRQGQVQFTGAR
jgi:hypothetical protein